LDNIHIVTTTLGTAGSRALEAANKFEVVVIDEAAQSVEPSTLAGLQLGSSHAILVGDPQVTKSFVIADEYDLDNYYELNVLLSTSSSLRSNFLPQFLTYQVEIQSTTAVFSSD
jgi:superfamily I DNA and/or RNA helicase